MDIRNIAIIAHVDHGKTTITDALMKQNGLGVEGVSMDSNDLEKERGITIYAKNTSVIYKGTKINILDTPGHADFGSEVERVLRSIDCVLLIVDAAEGPMPQTRFVLKKSLELGLKPIVVINKIDKQNARPDEVHELVYELFLDLGATDEQLDFKTLYAVGRDGIAKRSLDEKGDNLNPILDTILEEVPLASGREGESLSAQIFNLGYDDYLGRMAICRIYSGVIKDGQQIIIKDHKGKNDKNRITKLFTFNGLNKEAVSEASAGDIIMVAGIPDAFIGDTILEKEEGELLPSIHVDEPTITLNFLVNNSPFGGRDGKFVTGRQIRERLENELEVNVGLRVDFSNSDSMKVSGRGELHIGVLLEQMRREKYELQVSKPEAVIKEENGRKTEPFEELTIDVPEEFSGTIIEKISKRKGIMNGMVPEEGGMVRITFDIPTRGLLGYRNEFVIDTKGRGVLSSRFTEFKEYVGEIEMHDKGSMISMATGKALGFALFNLQERGTLYIGPNTEVYEGMVIGNVSKGPLDMTVNPTKGKQLTNMRASGSDENIDLVPPTPIDIEKGLDIVKEDEYLEVTPNNVRLRKKFLTETERNKAGRGK